MSIWRKICCCLYPETEVDVDKNTRLLPLEDRLMQKIDTPLKVLAYGIVPSQFHQSRLPENYCSEGIKKVVCGNKHTLILTKSNYILACGDNHYGQCAKDPFAQEEIGSEEIIEESLTLKLHAFNVGNHEILDIAAGSNHSLILAKPLSGGRAKVMAFGHELACGFLDKTNKWKPTEVEMPPEYSHKEIVKVFAGQMRSGVLLESGEVLAWGEWFDVAKQRTPQRIEVNLEEGDSVLSASFGKMSAILLTKQGRIYTVGDNTYGELGLPSEITSSIQATQVKTFRNKRIVGVDSGARHCIVLQENGKVYTFGDNSEGQCGIDYNRTYRPQQVDTGDLEPWKVFAGDSHSGFITKQGEMYLWGDNTAGRLGTSESTSIFKPSLLQDSLGFHVCGVALGGYISVFILGTKEMSLVKH